MEFAYHGMELDVPDSVYYPDDDSLLLAEAVSEKVKKDDIFLEIGCGAGLCSLIAARKEAIVTSADINEEAVIATERNAAINGISLKAVQSDLFSSISGKFSLIAFNPPYLPEDETDRHLGSIKDQLIGGHTGREIIERFLKEAKARLKKSGSILLLISSLTGEHEVIEMCSKYGYNTSVTKKKEIDWEELMVLRLRAEIAESRRPETNTIFGVII